MPLGDSLTSGNYSVKPVVEGGYRRNLYRLLTEAGYTFDFIGTLTNLSDHPDLPDPHHEGWGGYRIHELDAQIEASFAAVAYPDVILLMIGTNDFSPPEWDGPNAINRLVTLIDHVATLRPGAIIIVSTLPPRTDHDGVPDARTQTYFNPYVAGVVADQVLLGRNVFYMDIRETLSVSDLIDPLHPGPEGYDKMGQAWFDQITSILGPPLQSAVMGAYVFYNQSAWDGGNAAANAGDDGAIATDKTPLLPGGKASFANYTSYSRGLNGVMIDISNLPGTPTAVDFLFKRGNNNTPAGWSGIAAPGTIAVRPGQGVGGSDRITLIWGENAVKKQWLEVTVLATANTGLAAPYVFYFGNAIGETGTFATDAKVDAADQLGARSHQRTLLNPAPIDFAFDFDRDKKVDASDQLIARANQTTALNALNLIDLSGAALSGLAMEEEPAMSESGSGRSLMGENPEPGRLWIELDSNGGFVLRLVTGLNQSCRLQATERLGNGLWKDLETPAPVVRQGLTHWMVPISGAMPCQFYRVVPVPTF